MTQDETIEKRRGLNAHDRFGRKYLANTRIAADLLRFYADPVVAETVNIDQLRPAPTHGISKAFKEVIMDVAFLARLRNDAGTSEVLFTI